VRPLPGARRLLEHLQSCGAKVAIATSTSRATFDKKLAKKPWMRELFQAAVCGDEVSSNSRPFYCHSFDRLCRMMVTVRCAAGKKVVLMNLRSHGYSKWLSAAEQPTREPQAHGMV